MWCLAPVSMNKKDKEKKFFYDMPEAHSTWIVHRHALDGGYVEHEVSSLVDVTGLKDVYVTNSFGNKMKVSFFFVYFNK